MFYCFNPFQGCRWVLWPQRLPWKGSAKTVSIPFRAVAGFFGITIRIERTARGAVSIPFRAVAGFFERHSRRQRKEFLRFNPFQGCRWVLCYREDVSRRVWSRSVSIPFRAVAGFFGPVFALRDRRMPKFQSLSGLSLGSLRPLSVIVHRYLFRGFNPFQGCRWVLCWQWLTLLLMFLGFNPFQGCRWVLCNLIFYTCFYKIMFQSLSGLSLGFLSQKMQSDRKKEVVFQSLSGLSLGSLNSRIRWRRFNETVSIPFRAVAGFFALEHTVSSSILGCFNPFQGCRWVLWNIRNIYVNIIVIVSIPFRAVAGFFVLTNSDLTNQTDLFQSLSGLSLGSLKMPR